MKPLGSHVRHPGSGEGLPVPAGWSCSVHLPFGEPDVAFAAMDPLWYCSKVITRGKGLGISLSAPVRSEDAAAMPPVWYPVRPVCIKL